MKITTEKLPRSLIALQIELDKDRLERGLDQAARRLSQKYPVHGFRPGKVPRFIIERTFGRQMLIEEASEDLINKAFREALKQENIEPVGPPSLKEISSSDPFIFTVHVPVAPTVDVGDYRAIRVPLEIEPIAEETVDRAMEMIRERHKVLKELDSPRPVQEGDEIRVRLDTIIDGAPLVERAEGEAAPEETLDVVRGRLVEELYAGLLGMNVGETKEITARLPDDHPNERVRGKEVTFKVEILQIQERLLPDWEELPTLENFDGTLEELRARTRAELEETARTQAEQKVLNAYLEHLVAQTSFDIPEVMIRDQAEEMLEREGRQYARYGVTLEQVLEYRGQTRDQAVEALLPQAERQLQLNLAAREVLHREGLVVSDAEIESEIERMALEYAEDQRENVAKLMRSSLQREIAGLVLDRKLRERLVAIATGTAPAPEAPATPVAPAAAGESSEPAAAEAVATEAPVAAESPASGSVRSAE
ncbi:MAG: trigger factor [Oscillochloridaceae bacterium]|nr:trigger factor [Chloroflexaceae bacterium]MDW8391675.1 trigger factor [Oscillochloridaceae bacterium]